MGRRGAADRDKGAAGDGVAAAPGARARRPTARDGGRRLSAAAWSRASSTPTGSSRPADGAELPPREAAVVLREALALWRGPALADQRYEAWAQAEIRRLEELRALGDRGAREGRPRARRARTARRRARGAGGRAPAPRAPARAADARAVPRPAATPTRSPPTVTPAPPSTSWASSPGRSCATLEQAILTHDPSLAAPSAPRPGSRPPLRRRRSAATTTCATSSQRSTARGCSPSPGPVASARPGSRSRSRARPAAASSRSPRPPTPNGSRPLICDALGGRAGPGRDRRARRSTARSAAGRCCSCSTTSSTSRTPRRCWPSCSNASRTSASSRRAASRSASAPSGCTRCAPLDRGAGAALFADRARARDPAFALTTTTPPRSTTICERLAGTAAGDRARGRTARRAHARRRSPTRLSDALARARPRPARRPAAPADAPRDARLELRPARRRGAATRSPRSARSPAVASSTRPRRSRAPARRARGARREEPRDRPRRPAGNARARPPVRRRAARRQRPTPSRPRPPPRPLPRAREAAPSPRSSCAAGLPRVRRGAPSRAGQPPRRDSNGRSTRRGRSTRSRSRASSRHVLLARARTPTLARWCERALSAAGGDAPAQLRGPRAARARAVTALGCTTDRGARGRGAGALPRRSATSAGSSARLLIAEQRPEHPRRLRGRRGAPPTEALERARRLGDDGLIGGRSAQVALGDRRDRRGVAARREAAERLRAASALCHDAAGMLSTAGMAALREDAYERSEQSQRDGARRARRRPAIPYTIAIVHGNIGLAALLGGRPERAWRRSATSSRIAHEQASGCSTSKGCSGIAALAAADGDDQRAAVLHAAAWALSDRPIYPSEARSTSAWSSASSRPRGSGSARPRGRRRSAEGRAMTAADAVDYALRPALLPH